MEASQPKAPEDWRSPRRYRVIRRFMVPMHAKKRTEADRRRGGLNRVSPRSGRAAAAGPVGVEEFAARFVDPFVGVSAEVIALGLEQIRREHSGAILIVERQRGAERRH